ncbi:MAG: PqiC family protein [Myxococcota bacterium]
MHKSFLTLSVILGAFGCVNSNPSLYTLQPAPLEELSSYPNEIRIGVNEVRLPDYARDVRFAARQEDGSIVHLEEHRWADNPTRVVTRVLAVNLRELTARPVFGEPWPVTFEPTVFVAVDFFELDATRAGEMRFQGQFVLHKRDSDTEPHVESFEISSSVSGESFDAVMRDIAGALAELATRIAKAAG